MLMYFFSFRETITEPASNLMPFSGYIIYYFSVLLQLLLIIVCRRKLSQLFCCHCFTLSTTYNNHVTQQIKYFILLFLNILCGLYRSFLLFFNFREQTPIIDDQMPCSRYLSLSMQRFKVLRDLWG